MDIARQVTRVILEGFADYRTRFTLGARQRFLQADWNGAQQAASDRINLYPSPFKLLRCCQRSLTPITYYL